MPRFLRTKYKKTNLEGGRKEKRGGRKKDQKEGPKKRLLTIGEVAKKGSRGLEPAVLGYGRSGMCLGGGMQRGQEKGRIMRSLSKGRVLCQGVTK